MPPYAAYVARTIFLHTLAFNDPLKGLPPEQLRYSVLCPGTDISFIEEARRKFVAESAYLDDRPGAPMRFLAEANLRQIIRREERNVDAGEARAELNDRIREIFEGKTFDARCFPGRPFDVPDEVGDGRPKLVVLSYDAAAIGSSVDNVPELVERTHTRKGSEGAALRVLRNNLVFAVADDARRADMRRKTYHRLALRELKKPEHLNDLAEHQQAKVRELEARSEQELAIAIQQCYRHIFYPSRDRLSASDVDLAHSAIDMHSASDQPGAGQQQIVRALRDLRKLRLIDARVPGVGSGRPASAGVPRAAASGCRFHGPASGIRADVRGRARDAGRRGREAHGAPCEVRERGRIRVGDSGSEGPVTRREKAIRVVETPDSAPRYELRVRRHGPADAEYEIWQMPVAATPHVTSPLRVAGLRGRNLELVEHRVLKRLAEAKVKLGRSADSGRPGYPLSEDLALTLGLLFRTLAPMRSRDNMRAVTEGIEAMEREETAYWLGMAMHRRHPRRALTALRILLTEPPVRSRLRVVLDKSAYDARA